LTVGSDAADDRADSNCDDDDDDDVIAASDFARSIVSANVTIWSNVRSAGSWRRRSLMTSEWHHATN
jgi:hypothetical protein